MSVAATPSYSSLHRASAIMLGVGFAVSVMIHLGVGVGASGYFGSVWGSDDSSDMPIETEPDSAELNVASDEIRLGMQDSVVASINWLGVIDNPEVGDAPEAEVEQAEFTRAIGDAPVTVSPEPAAQPMPEIEAVEQVAVQEEQGEEVEPESLAMKPTEQIEFEVEPDEEAPVLIEVQAEAVDEPTEELIEEPDQEKSEEPIEESVEVDSPVGPDLVSVEPTPQAEAQPVEPVESSQDVAPTTAGKNGIVSKKESTASILKRAIEVNASKLNRPIVGKGLEITTVEPRFPASVRFTELPRNPVLMIRFNASGRVSKVYFLTEGRRVFDTGVKGVDEPLMSAVYQWRAKGKEIDVLDPGLNPNDPESYVEISMRITFRKERKKP